jgi:hypothetical protein
MEGVKSRVESILKDALNGRAAEIMESEVVYASALAKFRP